MNLPVPTHLTLYLLTGMIIIIAALLLGLRSLLRRSTWPARTGPKC